MIVKAQKMRGNERARESAWGAISNQQGWESLPVVFCNLFPGNKEGFVPSFVRIFCIFMQRSGGVQQFPVHLPFISTPRVYSISKPNPSNGEDGKCSTPLPSLFLSSGRVCKLKYKYKYSILKMIHGNIIVWFEFRACLNLNRTSWTWTSGPVQSSESSEDWT